MQTHHLRLRLMWLTAFLLVVLVATAPVLAAFRTVGFGWPQFAPRPVPHRPAARPLPGWAV